MKISRSRLREIIRQSIQEEKDYEEFFRSELEKTGYSSPAEMSDDEKREFFSNVDKGWEAKNEGNAFGAAVTAAKEAGEDSFEVDGKEYKVESVNEEFKHTIYIDTPRQVASKKIAAEIEALAKKGIRSKEIGLKMGFVGNQKAATDAFQKIKNKVYFSLHKDESVNESTDKWYIEKWDADGDSTTVKTYSSFDKSKIQSDFDRIAKSLNDDEEVHFMRDSKKHLGEYILSVVNQNGKLKREITKGSRTMYSPYKISDGIRESINYKYDLASGKLGNGITIFNSKETDPNTGDYKVIAHISDSGKIDWKDKEAQKYPKIKRWVDEKAKSMNEAKIGNGDLVRVVDKPKNVMDKSLWGKSGVVMGKDGRHLRVKFTTGRTILVHPTDLELNERKITEGNAFGAAVTQAKKEGKKEFEFNGKTYKVKKGSYEKNEANKEQSETITESDIKVGSKVVVNYPTLKAPVKGVVSHILNDKTGKVYVLKGDKGVWDESHVSLVESVDFATTKEIASLTELRVDTVKKFVDSHNINGKKLLEYIRGGKLKDRMDFMTAVSGKPGNPIQTKIVKMFGESVNEDVNFRDGKYRFYSKNSVGYLTYNGKLLSKGDYDFEGGDSYWMSHSSWKGQKAFDTGKDVIKYFKSKNITTESVNEGKHDVMLDKLANIVKDAKSFMDVGKVLKSNGIKYSFSTSMIPMYKIDKQPIAIVNKKYAAGAEREIGDIAIGLLESIKTK